MIRVGVTGGIGSGKSTLCHEWEKLGAFVVYADDIAKELMVSDPKLIEEIMETFGEASYHSDGSLNRAHLAKEAFEKNRVEELNALVHPALWQHIDELAEAKEKEGIDIFVKEAALLLKNGRPENIDKVVLLLADEERRIDRVVGRDHTEEQKVKERIDKQDSFEDLKHLADFVITNDGSLSDLKQQARTIFHTLKEET